MHGASAVVLLRGDDDGVRRHLGQAQVAGAGFLLADSAALVFVAREDDALILREEELPFRGPKRPRHSMLWCVDRVDAGDEAEYDDDDDSDD